MIGKRGPSGTRIAILREMWNRMFPSCACGKCPCSASSPEQTRTRAFGTWSIELYEAWEAEVQYANKLEAILIKTAKKRPRTSEYTARLDAQERDIVADVARRRKVARRLGRLAHLYGRIAKGLPPFAKESE